MRFITCLIETREVNMSGLAPVFDESIYENSKMHHLSMVYVAKLASKDEIYIDRVWKGLQYKFYIRICKHKRPIG